LSPASPRLKSIDVFRGTTIAAIILVNGQFSHEDSYRQFAHATWHGWSFADTIFPSFLLIVGVSLTLSIASRVARSTPTEWEASYPPSPQSCSAYWRDSFCRANSDHDNGSWGFWAGDSS
jgi:hypothetical protein